MRNIPLKALTTKKCDCYNDRKIIGQLKEQLDKNDNRTFK